jgi:serine protease AprX
VFRRDYSVAWSGLRLAAASALLLVVLPASGYAAKPEKLDSALRRAAKEGSGSHRVIIQLKPGGAGRVGKKISAHGDKIHHEHRLINALSAEVHGRDVLELSDDDDVVALSLDATVTADAAADGKGSGKGSGGSKKSTPTQGSTDLESLNTIRGTLNLVGVTHSAGYGIGVAVIDSGISPSRDFSGRITAFYDFVNGTVQSTQPLDEYGHGTHVAGLIGGDGSLSYKQYMGVAPKVRFIGMRVLDRRGAGFTSNVIAALELAVAQKNTLGIDLINLSLGHPIYEPVATDPLVRAVEAAVRAGIVVVASAGNYGADPNTLLPAYGGITSPGSAPSAITIGAFKTKESTVRSDDRVSGYSSRGPSWYDGLAKPDLVAPGHREVSDAALQSELFIKHPELQLVSASNNPHLILSGTSMATAVASGVAALVLEAGRNAAIMRQGSLPEITSYYDFYAWYESVPHFTPNAVKAMLQYTAIPLAEETGVVYDALTQGAGAINAEGAIRLAQLANPSVAAGAKWITTTVDPHTTIGGESCAWSQNIVWSDSIITGDSLLYNLSAWADGLNIVWSDRTVWGGNIVWSDLVPGTTLVDSTNIVWSDNVVWGDTALDDWSLNIVWGNSLVGAYDGSGVTWGLVTGETTTVWANLYPESSSPAHAVQGTKVIWGNAACVVWGDRTRVVWGDAARVVWGDSVLVAADTAVMSR